MLDTLWLNQLIHVPTSTTPRYHLPAAFEGVHALHTISQHIKAMVETGSLQRRFKPELVESTTSSSSSSTPPTKPRRFAPEPVETSTRSSRDPPHSSSGDSTPRNDTSAARESDPHIETPKARRKFAPEPIETTTRHSKKSENIDDSDYQAPLLPHERTSPSEDSSQRPARRKFAPQLIETAKRSKRAGDRNPAVLQGDKTNVTPGDPHIHHHGNVKHVRPSPTPLPPSNTPTTSSQEVPTFSALRPAPLRQGSMRPHYNTRQNTRQHSYRIPSLPSIDSSGSGGSDEEEATEDSDTSDEAYKDATRMRESVDERFSGYLLALAAKQAEKQLREQEAAAFINTDYHEPVAHYMNRDDSDEDISEPSLNQKGRVDRTRKDSGDEKALLERMREHGEKVFKHNQARGKTAAFNVEFDSSGPFRQDIWENAGGQFSGPQSNSKRRELIGGKQQDPSLRQMRKAASPPMLGGDIDFPRCPSPDNARFDVTQGAEYLRKNVCYLGEQAQEVSGGKLWGKNSGRKQEEPTSPSVWGAKKPSSPQPKPKSPGGLWGGTCNKVDAEQAPPMPTGLMTPSATPGHEREDPFAALGRTPSLASNKNSYTNLASMGNAPAGLRPMSPVSRGAAPPSPPMSTCSPSKKFLMPPNSDLDARLALESRINDEFGDDFVTQVYNYLSLGYPSLARKFDDELARISKFDLEELREDDKLAEVRGYVRLGDDEVDGVKGIEETMCKRWRALRRYVREWGRQMLKREIEGGEWGDPQRAWGLPVRRGSWGL